jgi:uncharacterized membrane protein
VTLAPVDASSRPHAAWLALILLAGGLLILPRLAAQSLWVDEGLTVVAVTDAAGVRDLFERVRALDTQPPASHLVLYALRGVLPGDEFGWRLPSLLLTEAAIALLGLATARRFGWPIALLAAAAAQVSPFVAFYAMEARGYALWLFACCAALYAMTRWLEAPGFGRAIAWGLANALGLWTHPFHLFAMVMQVVLACAAIRSAGIPAGSGRRTLVSGVAAQAIAVVLFMPYLLDLLSRDPALRGVGWTRTPTGVSILYYPFALVFGFSFGPSLDELHAAPWRTLLAHHLVAMTAAAAALLVLALAALLLARRARGDTRHGSASAAAAIVVALVAGLLGPAFYVALRDFPLLPRHLIYVWPLVPILEAVAIARLPRLRPLLLAVLALQGLAFLNLLYNPVYAKDDERGAIRFALGRSGVRPVIVGDVAPVYAPPGRGLLRNHTDPGDPTRFADATDVWLVDSRAWEDPDGHFRARLQRALDGLGMAYAGEEGSFRGVVLRHWRSTAPPGSS